MDRFRNFEGSNSQPTDLMVALVEASWLSKAIYVVVSLGIPDLLRNGPRPGHELAAVTGTHAPTLQRVMRALAVEGIFAADELERFVLTPLGMTLRSDVPGSLHDWALLMLGKTHQEAWNELIHSVRTGESAFQHWHGMDLWQYRSRHSNYAKLFDAAMASFTGTYIDNLLGSYSCSAFRKIIDVGGGDGSLLIGILQKNPGAQGIVYDLPEAAERARERIHEVGLTGRCLVQSGDVFLGVPAGGDAYILSRVLHDWDDDNACKILASCRKAMPVDGCLLVIERVMPHDLREMASSRNPVVSDISLTDLNMLVMTSGRERTIAEYQELFATADLQLIRIAQTQTAMRVMEVKATGGKP